MKYKFIFPFIFLILIYSCRTNKTVIETSFKSIPVLPSANLSPDTSIINFIVPYKQIIDKEMLKKVVFSEFEIDAGVPDGALNQIVADAVLLETQKYVNDKKMTSIDMVLLNHGGLRKSLPKGDINIGNIYELMPFDNTVAIVTLSGETMKELFKFLASKNEGHPISNASFTIENNNATNIIINGIELNPDKNYRVVTNDYLISGNDGMSFFKKSIKIELLPILIRDAIIHQLPNININTYKKENIHHRILIK